MKTICYLLLFLLMPMTQVLAQTGRVVITGQVVNRKADAPKTVNINLCDWINHTTRINAPLNADGYFHAQMDFSVGHTFTLHYRDKYTEGYNITPNFFIRSRVTKEDLSFDNPAIKMTYWDEAKHLEYPRTNKHFEDRIFDRDTLILREFSINLLFVIAAYAGYEEEYWRSDLHRTIRELFIRSIDKEYEFFILTPQKENINKFYCLYYEWINGKAYTLETGGKNPTEHLLLAFEKTDTGKKDKETFLSQKLREYTTGEELLYDLQPITLVELNKK